MRSTWAISPDCCLSKAPANRSTSAADALIAALEDARLANGFGSYHRGTSGLSIYFPQLEEYYIDEYERGSPLPRITRWAEFLTTYHTTGETAVSRPTISDLRVTDTFVSLNQPVELSGALAGDDIANVFSFIGIPNASRDTVDLIYVDYVYPPGTVPDSGEVPNWSPGEYNLSLNWDASSWFLSNGTDEIEVLLGPVKYGTSFYGIEGVYTSRTTGEEIEAGLIFSIDQGRGTLLRIWGFPRSEGNRNHSPSS
jgi:hypothetical protein